jgi:hypothetical protein
MKTELRLAAHLIVPGAVVVEVWYAGALIATVAGADGPGVRIISKHGFAPVRVYAPDVCEIKIPIPSMNESTTE